MATSANYYVYGVRYNNTHTHIDYVWLYRNNGNQLGPQQIVTRRQVVSSLLAGYVFVTIFRNNGQWRWGQEVRRVTINGVDYIRTDANRKEEDNLENLPEY